MPGMLISSIVNTTLIFASGLRLFYLSEVGGFVFCAVLFRQTDGKAGKILVTVQLVRSATRIHNPRAGGF